MLSFSYKFDKLRAHFIPLRLSNRVADWLVLVAPKLVTRIENTVLCYWSKVTVAGGRFFKDFFLRTYTSRHLSKIKANTLCRVWRICFFGFQIVCMSSVSATKCLSQGGSCQNPAPSEKSNGIRTVYFCIYGNAKCSSSLLGFN